MRFSQALIPTLKEVPAEAEVVSHKLMLRAGMIRKLASGIYTLLPLGLIVIRKVEQIIREEMNSAGAQELLMPAIQPAGLWEESNRWDEYGKELLRLKDRHNRAFCFGPTHEEVITDIVRKEVRSYRHLPLNLYQIQTKFRDEIRPRFGIMRGREFLMKDAYSFNCSEADTKVTYQKMYEAYRNIFSRCGLESRAVEADSGTIGGNFSHEFMVMAESGEDEIAICNSCPYAANREKAEYGIDIPSPATKKNTQEKIQLVETPNMKSVEEVAQFFNTTSDKLVKTLLFQADNEIIAVLVRGDYEICLTRLKSVLRVDELLLANETKVRTVTNAPSGFSGPIGLDGIKIIADYSVQQEKNYIVGANQENYHYINVTHERDFIIDEYHKIRKVIEGDRCPRCSDRLHIHRGIEVGHIFILGEKYSRKLNATYLDKAGKSQFVHMGCYGIGVGRTVAAAIEQNHDDQGIIWPVPIAPFHVVIIPLNTNDTAVYSLAEKLYASFLKKNISVLIDDRDERAGIKFKDADLIGIPFQLIIGKKGLQENKVEIKVRKTQEKTMVETDKVEQSLEDLIAQATSSMTNR